MVLIESVTPSASSDTVETSQIIPPKEKIKPQSKPNS